MRVAVAAMAMLWALAPAAALAATLTPGAEITGFTRAELNTKTARDGQRISIVTKSGSTIVGHLSEVVASTATKKAHMKLNFDTIRFADGSSAPIHAQVISVPNRKVYNLVTAGGEVLAGNIVGNVIGKKLGTNVGGLVGLIGGALYAYNTAANIVVPKDSPVVIRLTQPLNVPG
ncbi:MAG TPA: hypothetical protein VNJ51_00700 [Candidatus Dormibacteraeota bacterium]|nr:hypothetical protein [Candidatus Dormibacteraeota bacterium]